MERTVLIPGLNEAATVTTCVHKAAQFPTHPADAQGAAGGGGDRGVTAAELRSGFTAAELSGDQAGARQPEAPAAQSSQI